MIKTIDHYSYWNKNRRSSTEILDREKKALDFIAKVFRPGKSVIDVGCGSGLFMGLLKKRFPGINVKGVDFSQTEVNEARKNGFEVIQGNFEEGIKIKTNSFDIVYAGEIIEHLYNPDLCVEELNRILKKDGFLVLSTPNLCAWFNRILLPLGIQPLFLESSTKSKLVGSGPLKRLKKGSTPVGHVRIFTIAGLKDILEMYGFKILEIKGGLYEEGLPKSILPIDKLFNISPGLSSNLILIAKKTKKIS